LAVKSLSAHLSPRGLVPSDAIDIVLNQQPSDGPGVPIFDLTNAPDTLSSKSISNTDVVECDLSIDGVLRAEDWNDLYLLIDYEVVV
jgi:hypothetical protein